jgi:hypothetical protein
MVRATGFALAYSLATAIFGGTTPLIVTWLIRETGNRAIPGVWLSLVALLGLVASTILSRKPYEGHGGINQVSSPAWE